MNFRVFRKFGKKQADAPRGLSNGCASQPKHDVASNATDIANHPSLSFAKEATLLTKALQANSRLLSIPTEIRLVIFSHLAADPSRESAFSTYKTEIATAISIRSRPKWNYSMLTSLMCTCQATHEELEDFIYSRVSFTIVPAVSNDLAMRNVTRAKIYRQAELPFLCVAQNVQIQISMRSYGHWQPELEKASIWIETLLRSTKVKSFRFELYVLDDSANVKPASLDHLRSIMSAGGFRRQGMLGSRDYVFSTRNLKVANIRVERMKTAFAELETLW